MKNIILEKIAGFFLVLMLLFSVIIFIRGHNNPGGGFIGGTVAAVGFIFYGIIHGVERVKRLVRITTIEMMGAGLLMGITALSISSFAGMEPATAIWFEFTLFNSFDLHLGTPLLFDAGIYFVVTGAYLSIIISVMEVLKWN